MVAATEKKRTFALVGHGGSGKTSLAEAVLFSAGAVNRLGVVEDGTATLDSGEEDHTLIAMAKWFCAQNAVTIAQECLQLHGGYGFLNEYDIARFFRDSKILEIYEGTKEMEKQVISNAILGKAN